MSDTERFVWLNGQFLPRSQAKLDLEDRGAMFADGVYEVTRYYDGRPFAMAEHIARLKHSLAQVRITEPAEVARLGAISGELLARNGMKDAIVYWQVTRGSSPRKHVFPPSSVKPTMFVIAYSALKFDPAAPPQPKTAILHEDLRWHQCSIKSLMLLANVLAKQKAEEQGAYEAILHRGDVVTEGTATSVMIVRHGELWTHPANQLILGSITRAVLIDLARRIGVPVCEQPFTVKDLLASDEAFVCGTTSHVTPIVKVGDQTIGGGATGPVSTRLHEALVKHICEKCGVN
jgi:D-alanine transaminase